MLDEALAQARSSGARRITELHLVLYDSSPGLESRLREAVQRLSENSLAEGARVVTRKGPNRFICWNCCGLRFESADEEAVCPNCGHMAVRIPEEITFALDHIETETAQQGEREE